MSKMSQNERRFAKMGKERMKHQNPYFSLQQPTRVDLALAIHGRCCEHRMTTIRIINV